ncbi:MAG: hypothetical protein Cons2KO_28170 [Congregibacter sp.]
MSNRLKRLLRYCLCCIQAALCLSGSAHASTVEELLTNGQLEARLVIETAEPFYQKAPIIIAIEIGTPRWFARGTRVSSFRVAGAIVRPVSSFADNQTQRRADASWSFQRWRYRVYPQQTGTLERPPISASVSINTADEGIVSGDVRLAAVRLDVTSPPGVSEQQPWLATPDLRIEERWEGLRDGYEVGDAITRVRRFTAVDTPAMMIEESLIDPIEGLSLYAAPPELRDESSRGQLTGTREERLIITIEAPGEYELPGLQYQWFSTSTQRLETIEQAAFQFSVGADQGSDLDSPASPVAKRDLSWLISLLGWGSVSLVVAFLFLAVSRMPLVVSGTRWLRKRYALQRAYRRYQHDCQRADFAAALQRVYTLLCDVSPSRSFTKLLSAEGEKTLRCLQAHAYAPHGGSPLPTSTATRNLWREVQRLSDGRAQNSAANHPPSGPGAALLERCVRLNPGAS